ncbi:MAG: phage major tail protein, TP901-1 family [Kiloniellales bacterium]
MAAQKGRSTLLYADLAGGSPQNYTLLPGLRDTDWAVNGEQVDVTTKDTDTWRKLLAGAGVRSVDISVAGIFQDAAVEETVRGWAFDQSINWWQIKLENGDRLEFQAQIRSYTRTAPYQDADQYSFSLESHGAPFYYAA